MKPLLSLFLGLVVPALCLAVEPAVRTTDASAPPEIAGQRVFICGHSFHMYIAKLLPGMARAAGIANFALAGQQGRGGSTVLQHWQLPDEKAKAKAALRAGTVDALTLSPNLLMPDPGIGNYTRLGLEKNPRLRVYVQESWIPRDGTKDAKQFRKEQRDQTPLAAMRTAHMAWLRPLEAQVRALNQSVGREAVFIVPACDAVYALRERVAAGKVPGIKSQVELFRDALGHPTEPIAVLNAYCHFAAIFGRDPAGLPVPASLQARPHAEELNRLLQQLAWDAVTAHPMSGVKAKQG